MTPSMTRRQSPRKSIRKNWPRVTGGGTKSGEMTREETTGETKGDPMTGEEKRAVATKGEVIKREATKGEKMRGAGKTDQEKSCRKEARCPVKRKLLRALLRPASSRPRSPSRIRMQPGSKVLALTAKRTTAPLRPILPISPNPDHSSRVRWSIRQSSRPKPDPSTHPILRPDPDLRPKESRSPPPEHPPVPLGNRWPRHTPLALALGTILLRPCRRPLSGQGPVHNL
jgi:hypothetical protein